MFKKSLKAINEAVKKEWKATTESSDKNKELKLLDGVNGIDYSKKKER